jgi:hypothetical protein
MEHVVKFGNARIVFNADEYDHASDDGDNFGGGSVSVKCRDWLRVYKRQEFTLYMWDLHDVQELFQNNPDAEMSLESDDFIVFLDAVSREPRRKYSWYWNGLSYWLFHDITHAKHDVYGGSVEVNDLVEDRTLYEGAMLARKHGVKVAQIVRELSRSEKPYLDRFKRTTSAMDRFLHEIGE